MLGGVQQLLLVGVMQVEGNAALLEYILVGYFVEKRDPSDGRIAAMMITMETKKIQC